MYTVLDKYIYRVIVWGILAAMFTVTTINLIRFYTVKKTIGSVEEVTLVKWGIRLPSRIDTGAATSALSVRDLARTNNIVKFRFPKKWGGKSVSLPVVDLRTVKSSDGDEEVRPVVDVEIRLAGKVLHTQVTLDDRSHMFYPMLIGRRTLKGNFVVDVERARSEVAEGVEGTKE
jgi:hypothetical protein